MYLCIRNINYDHDTTCKINNTVRKQKTKKHIIIMKKNYISPRAMKVELFKRSHQILAGSYDASTNGAKNLGTDSGCTQLNVPTGASSSEASGDQLDNSGFGGHGGW